MVVTISDRGVGQKIIQQHPVLSNGAKGRGGDPAKPSRPGVLQPCEEPVPCPATSVWCSPALPASAVSRVTWVAGPAASYSGSSAVPPEQGRGKGRRVARGRIPRLPQRRESGLGIAHPGHAARVSAPAPPATVSQPEPSAVTLLARSSGGGRRGGGRAPVLPRGPLPSAPLHRPGRLQGRRLAQERRLLPQ